MRDWMATLWPASYKGVPFWVEKDGADVGKRLAITEFPGSDVPFIEELGQKAQTIEITGYLIGDASDAQISALEMACGQAGAGTLVMPAQGPLQAQCEFIKRDRLRDKMGRFGFSAKFVLLAPASQASAPAYLAQLTFDAVGMLSAAAPAFLDGISL